MTGEATGGVGRCSALTLWARGRHAPIAADSTVVTASRGTAAMPLMFGVATVIEMAVLHLLIPWLWVDLAIAAFSVASLAMPASAVAVARVHPHVLSPEALTLRASGRVVARVDRKNMVSARVHRRYGAVTPTLDGNRLVLPNQDGTSVDIELRTAVTVTVSAPSKRWRIDGTATSFGLAVDDPVSLVAALDRGLSTRTGTITSKQTPGGARPVEPVVLPGTAQPTE